MLVNLRILIVLFCIGLTGCLSGEKDKRVMNKKESSFERFQIENPDWEEADLHRIVESLKKIGEIENLDYVYTNSLRLQVDSATEQYFIVHLGSADPYSGGSGANFKVDRRSWVAELISTETLEPAPGEEH